MKYLGQNGIKLSKKYNVELADIAIGPQSLITTITMLMKSLLINATGFNFHAAVYSHAEIPVYFHPNRMENGIPPAPWGYFSHIPSPTSEGKDSLMEPDPNAPEHLYDTYRSTLSGVVAVV